MRILIVHIQVPFPPCPCPCTCEMANVLKSLESGKRKYRGDGRHGKREQESLWPDMCRPHQCNHVKQYLVQHSSLSNNLLHVPCIIFGDPMQYTVAYSRTTQVLEVYTLTRKLCTLDQGCGSFSGCLYGCMDILYGYGYQWKETWFLKYICYVFASLCLSRLVKKDMQ